MVRPFISAHILHAGDSASGAATARAMADQLSDATLGMQKLNVVGRLLRTSMEAWAETRGLLTNAGASLSLR